MNEWNRTVVLTGDEVATLSGLIFKHMTASDPVAVALLEKLGWHAKWGNTAIELVVKPAKG